MQKETEPQHTLEVFIRMKNDKTKALHIGIVSCILMALATLMIVSILYMVTISNKNRLDDVEEQVEDLEQITPDSLHEYINENVIAVILLIEVIDAEIQTLEESGDDPERIEVLKHIRESYYEAYSYWVNHPPDLPND